MWYARLVALAWALLATPAAARDLYVNNRGGDDQFDGSAAVSRGSNEGPCRTLARVLRGALAGDRIILANSGEPYRESITLQAQRHSGTPDRPFQVIGNGAILEGAAAVPDSAWEHAHGEVFRFAPPRKAYQMLFLGGRPAQAVPVESDGLRMPELEPRQWCLFERYVYFRPDQGRLPHQCEVTCAALTVGITLYEVRHVVISDLIVQGFQLDGINAHDGAVQATLRGVTCRGNARSGIAIGGASQVTLEGCVVGNNGAAQVRTEGQSRTRLIDCDLLDNTAPALVREGGQVEIQQPAEQPAQTAGRDSPPAGRLSRLPARQSAY